MIAARTIDGPAYPEMIEEMERELTEVIEDFDRAMNFEALRLANETSKLSFPNLSIVDPQWFGVERVEQERMERERMERERVERERVERERVEQERVEQELLFRRLEPVKAGYHRELRCMDGTRQSLLNQVMDWVEIGRAHV